jgi:hypothetical protein
MRAFLAYAAWHSSVLAKWVREQKTRYPRSARHSQTRTPKFSALLPKLCPRWKARRSRQAFM